MYYYEVRGINQMKWYDIIFLIISIILIVLVLLQGGRSGGASGAITGGGMNIFVKTKARGSELVLQILTLVVAIIFFLLAILISSIPAAESGGDPVAALSILQLR